MSCKSVALSVRPFWIFGMLMFSVAATGCGRRTTGLEESEASAVSVRQAPVRTQEFERTVKAQGTWAAETFALVPSRLGGTLRDLKVADGAGVDRGQALALIDPDPWEHAVESRTQDVAVARSALDVAHARREQATADAERSANDHRRFQALLSEEAVSEQAAEHVATQWRAAKAALNVADAQIALSEAQLRQAETALALAERDLRDTVVRAPIAGAVSHRFFEPGEMVGTNQPVFRIDDPGTIEFSAYLAEQHYPWVTVGKTRLRFQGAAGSANEAVASYRSPTVHERFRTFEIKTVVTDPPDDLAPGMAAQADVVLDRREGRGVPADAVVHRGGDTCVFSVVDGRARLHRVQTGYTANGHVEIRDGLPGDVERVVVQGQQALEDGTRVTVVDGEVDDVSF